MCTHCTLVGLLLNNCLAFPAKRVMYVHFFENIYYLLLTKVDTIISNFLLSTNQVPYSWKYWRSIKFGGLAVGEATVKFKSVKFKCDLRVRVRAYYMYGTTAKFKSANIFISAARDQTAKFKDRQYFRLYDTCI